MKTDETDERIIEKLKADSRASNVEIARSLGMTEGAVRWRIKRMADSGLISRFTIELSSGMSNYAVLMVKAKGETKKMMAAVSELKSHRDAYEISGEYDGCVILEGPSVEDIDAKIDKIRKLKEVADTRTYISFKRW
ncbi:MAG TPA: Lrp/AsnC family transcriptional regulator [Candidatus Bilamarchaeum sp.]|nr:Lrp/AsnC family transcriptional regulator [Candidatus Bilamarchaeum sp.]